MSNIFDVEVVNFVEHEDGGATYTFNLTEGANEVIAELGLKLLLYCGACGVSTEKVFDWLSTQLPKPEVQSFSEYGHYGENNGPVGDIRHMTDEERQRASEKAKRNNHV